MTTSASPLRVLYRRPGRDTLLSAAVAVGAVIVVQFVQAFVRLLGNAVAYDPTAYGSSFLDSPIGLFLGQVVLYPFPFYVVAFVAMSVFFPIVRQSPLSIVLQRAVVAGAAGTIVLALVGIATGVIQARAQSDSTYIVLYALFIPLAAGVVLTAVLAGGSALAWLWLGRQGPLTADEVLAARRLEIERAREEQKGQDARVGPGDGFGPAAGSASEQWPEPEPSRVTPAAPTLPVVPKRHDLPLSLFEPPASDDDAPGAP